MRRLVITAFLVVIICILALFCALWGWSPGVPKPFLDGMGKPLAGSISEKSRVLINGVEQGMFIKGKDVSKPVLLYVHGGMPDYFLTQKYQSGLEDYFIVVWWEQRGSGISYQPEKALQPVTSEQLIADVITMAKHLCQHFNKDKIYLMGHSGGTFIGIQAAARAPELFYAYLGVAQMSNQSQSEKEAYDYMLERYKEAGNSKMVRKLEAAPVTLAGGTPKSYLAIRDQAMHSLGIGTMHDMKSVISGIFFPSLRFREYTVTEKINLWRSKANSGVSIVWDEIMATDLSKKVPELQVPAYFFHGIYDYTCSYPEAKQYFERLKAPAKGFYPFRQSAHSPMFEEPEKMQLILREDVLPGLTGLADKN